MCWQVISVGILIGICVGPIISCTLLCIVGFTKCGVRKGSLAAEGQSLYGAKTGGSFSVLQSWGTCRPLPVVAFAVIGGIIGGIAGWKLDTPLFLALCNVTHY
jgi:hypothetical protein